MRSASAGATHWLQAARRGEAGDPDGERVERVGGRVEAGGGELADRSGRGVIVGSGAGLQRWILPMRLIRVRSSGASSAR